MGSFWFMVFFFGFVYFLIVGFLMQNVAMKKGYDNSTPEKTAHSILVCVCLGLFGVLYIMALPDLIITEKLAKLCENNPGENETRNSEYQQAKNHNSKFDDSLPVL